MGDISQHSVGPSVNRRGWELWMTSLQTPSTHGRAAGARRAERTPAGAATPANSFEPPLLQIPLAPALRSHRVQGAPHSRVSWGQGHRFPRWGIWEQWGGGADPTGSPLQVKVRTSWEQMGPAPLVKERFCYLC